MVVKHNSFYSTIETLQKYLT